MINFRILNITIPATTTCNSNILDVLNSKIKGNKYQLSMYSQNMMNRRTAVDRTYRSFADVVVAVTLLITTLEKTWFRRPALPLCSGSRARVFLCSKTLDRFQMCAAVAGQEFLCAAKR
jgi:hypothetical protein